jgi:protein-tyrosine phosphatase
LRRAGEEAGADGRLESAAIDPPPLILFVCTGNICRSPMAEGLLRVRLRARSIEAVVASAGLAFDGRRATPEAIAAATSRGVDIGGHRSRIVSYELIEGADLVIGMERMHVREAIVLARDSAHRIFTLKEIVRRGEATGARGPGEPLARWLERVAAGRRSAELLGESDADDVADPYRQSQDVYRRCVNDVSSLVDRLVGLAWPTASEGVA